MLILIAQIKGKNIRNFQGHEIEFIKHVTILYRVKFEILHRGNNSCDHELQTATTYDPFAFVNLGLRICYKQISFINNIKLNENSILRIYPSSLQMDFRCRRVRYKFIELELKTEFEK